MNCKMEERLASCDTKNVQKIPKKGLLQIAKIAEIIDGDTMRVCILHGDEPLSVSIRVKGVDAPETKRTTNLLEIETGKLVKNFVVDLLESEVRRSKNGIIQIILYKFDKWGGRFVGDLWLERKKCFLSEYLLRKRCVKAYEGKKKEEWTTVELQKIITVLS